MQKIAIVFTLLSCIVTSYGQSRTELFDDGEYFFWREDYQEAVYYYLKLLEKYPENPNYNFKTGECYLNIPGKETLAIPFFEKAITNITGKNDYDRKDINEKHAPLHAYFYLGNAYRINNELDKALTSYNIFINHPEYEGNYNLTVVDNEIRATERAKIIQDSPISIITNNLGAPVNNAAKNTYPVVSADESSMVYISGLQFYDALFYVEKNDAGLWNTPVNISPQVGSDGDLYPTYLSPEGTTLILVKKQAGNDDLYISSFVENEWTKALPLETINTRSNESFGSLSPDGKTLYFTSERKSQGGSDIFVSQLDKTGEWSKAQNLGKTINTEFNEAAPYLTNGGKTLYFSSQGHYNMGGYDIFYSNKNDKGEWSEPINLGYPINNTGDNQFFYPLHRGEIGYMPIIQPGGMGEADIYRIEILSTLTHVFSSDRDKSLIEPTEWPLKKSFTLSIVDELTHDTIAIFEYNKRKNSFLYTDYNDNYKFQFE